MDDELYVCLYCADTMEMNADKIKRFGKPKCCDNNMVVIDRKSIYKIIKALDALKNKLEQETIKGYFKD